MVNREEGKGMKGRFEHNVDAKGRLSIPAKFRAELGENFVMTRGLDGCLALYSEDNWAKEEEKILALPNTVDSRKVQRYFFSNAMDCEFDSQGRVVIPLSLREKAGISKSVMVVGMANRAEIWDAERWNAYNEDVTDEDVVAAVERGAR